MNDNGKVRVSWGALAWGLTTVTAVLLTYADLRGRQQNLEAQQTETLRRITRLEDKLERAEERRLRR